MLSGSSDVIMPPHFFLGIRKHLFAKNYFTKAGHILFDDDLHPHMCDFGLSRCFEVELATQHGACIAWRQRWPLRSRRRRILIRDHDVRNGGWGCAVLYRPKADFDGEADQEGRV